MWRGVTCGHGRTPHLARLVVDVLLVGVTIPEEIFQDCNVTEALHFHTIEGGEVLAPDRVSEYSRRGVWSN